MAVSYTHLRAHEVNFVGNYYNMGPATSMKYILNAQLEGTGQGSQAYYMHDNIRQNYVGDVKQNAGAVAGKHGELVSDKEVSAPYPFVKYVSTVWGKKFDEVNPE